MADLDACMTIGQGDVYSYFPADCTNIIKTALNDPTSEITQTLIEWSGMDVNQIKAAFNTLTYCPEYNIYIDPDPSSNKWDLFEGGEYQSLAEAIAIVGENMELDCQTTNDPLGPGIITVTSSYQGGAFG